MGRAQLAIIAVVAALLAFGAGLLVFDDDRDPVLEGGATTTTAAAATTVPSTVPAPDGAMPTTFVAVTDDGRVVVVDVASGRAVRQLAAGDHSAERAVALSADRSTAFFSECCTPAAGVLHRVPVAGGKVDEAGSGHAPAASADGRFVAVVDDAGFQVKDLVGDQGRRAKDDEHGRSYQSIALSPDGALVAADFVDGEHRGVVVAKVADLPSSERDDPPPASLAELQPPRGASWGLPVFRADGKLVVVEQCCGLKPKGAAVGRVVDPATSRVVASFRYPSVLVDQDYDPSGTWLVTTHADGSVHWQGKGKSGTLGEGYRSADW